MARHTFQYKVDRIMEKNPRYSEERARRIVGAMVKKERRSRSEKVGPVARKRARRV